MRGTWPGGIALMALVTACGHTEPVASGDGRAVAPTGERGAGPVAVADSGAGPVAVAVADSGPDAVAVASAAAGPDSDVLPETHCLADAGASHGPVLVRFVNRPVTGPNVPRGCQAEELVLEVPSVGFTRQLCSAACDPFHFDSQKKGPDAATFVCENAFFSKEGTATVVDGVLHIDVHDKVMPYVEGGFGGAPRVLPPSTAASRPDVVPLPCGARPDIKVAGPWSWPSERQLKKSSW